MCEVCKTCDFTNTVYVFIVYDIIIEARLILHLASVLFTAHRTVHDFSSHTTYESKMSSNSAERSRPFPTTGREIDIYFISIYLPDHNFQFSTFHFTFATGKHHYFHTNRPLCTRHSLFKHHLGCINDCTHCSESLVCLLS